MKSLPLVFTIAVIAGLVSHVFGLSTVEHYADMAIVLCILRWIVADGVEEGVRAAQK